MITVESGGTKSTWVYRNTEGKINSVTLSGLHPQEITSEKRNEVKAFIVDNSLEGSSIYFYGAGCESEAGRSVIQRLLEDSNLAIKEIASDVVGACKAVLGTKAGCVGILGTGAVVAQYDGSRVLKMASGRGFILGDEGSGFDIGKRITVAYLDGEFDQEPEVKNVIESHYGGAHRVVHACSAVDSRFKIAALTKEIAPFRENSLVKNILFDCFNDFFERGIQLLDHKNEIGMIGSVAYHFNEELSKVLKNRDVDLIAVYPEAAEEIFNFIDGEI